MHEPLFWLKMSFAGIWGGLSLFPTCKSLFLIFLCALRLLSPIALFSVSNAIYSYIPSTYLWKEKSGGSSTHDGKTCVATQVCDHGRDLGHYLNSTHCDVNGPRRSLLGHLSVACRDCSCCPDNGRCIFLVRQTGSDLERRRINNRGNGVKGQSRLPMIHYQMGSIMLNVGAYYATVSSLHNIALVLVSQQRTNKECRCSLPCTLESLPTLSRKARDSRAI
jgi:hypothetical protein